MCTFSVYQSAHNSLLDRLNSQRITGILCDVKMCVGNKIIWAHSCVLGVSSPYLSKLLLSRLSTKDASLLNNNLDKLNFVNVVAHEEDWSVNKPLEIKISVVNSEDGSANEKDCSNCAASVVDFMYLGKITIPDGHIDHVELFGKVLQISELLTLCSTYREKHVPGLSKDGLSCKDLHVNDIIVAKNVELTRNDDIVNNEQLGKCFLKSIEETRVHSDPDVISNDTVSYTQGQSEIVDSNYNISGDKRSCETSSKNSFSCSKCKLKYPNKMLLRQHRKVHVRKSYTCNTCGYSYLKVHELLKHLKESDHEEIVCSLCFFEADTTENLKTHLREHDHQKPFYCSVCEVRFQTRTALNLHIPKHSTEKPYVCSMCHRGFKWKHALQNHMVTHTPDKKHLCDQCGFSTAHKSTFKAHNLVHSGDTFKCPYPECKFEAVRKQNLQGHLLTHTKEKSYQCEICGQSFSLVRNLRRHALIHDSSNKFICCTICQFQTTRLDKLKEHVKKHNSKGKAAFNVRREQKRSRKELLKTSDTTSTGIVKPFKDTIENIQTEDVRSIVCQTDSSSAAERTISILSLNGNNTFSTQTLPSNQGFAQIPQLLMQTVYVFKPFPDIENDKISLT